MDNVMQFLFNTNHEQPSILVWVLLIVIADVLKYCYAIMDSLQPEASITTTFFKEECVL